MRYLLIGWLIFFGVGCSVTAKQPALHDFGLPVASSTTAPSMESYQDKSSINVNAPTWLWDNRIRYRLLFTSPSQIRFYGLDRWIASPPELLEQLLNVSCKVKDYAVIIRLHDFEQQFDTPDQARVVIRFSVEAYSTTNNKQKIGTQEFYLQQPTKTPDAAGAISGFTDLAQQAAKRIQDWLAGLADRRD
jgi:cholesterol transport system auxiliary component